MDCPPAIWKAIRKYVWLCKVRFATAVRGNELVDGIKEEWTCDQGHTFGYLAFWPVFWRRCRWCRRIRLALVVRVPPLRAAAPHAPSIWRSATVSISIV